MGSPRGARLTQGDWVTQKGGWWSDDERGTEMGRRVGASSLVGDLLNGLGKNWPRGA